MFYFTCDRSRAVPNGVPGISVFGRIRITVDTIMMEQKVTDVRYGCIGVNTGGGRGGRVPPEITVRGTPMLFVPLPLLITCQPVSMLVSL